MGEPRNPPILAVSGLTKSVYVVTRYKRLDGGRIEAQRKYDVTAGFERCAIELGWHRATSTEDAPPDPPPDCPRCHGSGVNIGAIPRGAPSCALCNGTGVAPSPEVTHACPPEGEGLTPCCGRTPFELPMTDRMTLDPALVTCVRALARGDSGGPP
jgi:hypothetical protein